MSLTAMWIHGSSVLVETPDRFSIHKIRLRHTIVDQDATVRLDTCRNTNTGDTA